MAWTYNPFNETPQAANRLVGGLGCGGGDDLFVMDQELLVGRLYAPEPAYQHLFDRRQIAARMDAIAEVNAVNAA